jgi:hypothetical protein
MEKTILRILGHARFHTAWTLSGRSGRGDPRKAAQEAAQAVVLALRRPQAALSRAVNSIEFREQYDTLLIIGVSACNDRDAALRSAQIVGQMRHIGADV